MWFKWGATQFAGETCDSEPIRLLWALSSSQRWLFRGRRVIQTEPVSVVMSLGHSNCLLMSKWGSWNYWNINSWLPIRRETINTCMWDCWYPTDITSNWKEDSTEENRAKIWKESECKLFKGSATARPALFSNVNKINSRFPRRQFELGSSSLRTEIVLTRPSVRGLHGCVPIMAPEGEKVGLATPPWFWLNTSKQVT